MTTSKPTEIREFWVDPTEVSEFEDSNDIIHKCGNCFSYKPDTQDFEVFHVIEYGAYERLKAENEDLKFRLIDRSEKYSIAIDKGVCELSDRINKLREQVKDYEQALKFYSSKAVWGNDDAEIDYCDVYFIDDMNVGIPRGGLIAIKVLKKWSEV